MPDEMTALALCAAGSRWRGRRAKCVTRPRHATVRGAPRPLPPIPAKVSSSKRQQTLSLRGEDCPSCPLRPLPARFELGRGGLLAGAAQERRVESGLSSE